MKRLRAFRLAGTHSIRQQADFVLPPIDDRNSWMMRQAKSKKIPKSYIFNEISGLYDTAQFTIDKTTLDFKLRDYSNASLAKR